MENKLHLDGTLIEKAWNHFAETFSDSDKDVSPQISFVAGFVLCHNFYMRCAKLSTSEAERRILKLDDEVKKLGGLADERQKPTDQ